MLRSTRLSRDVASAPNVSVRRGGASRPETEQRPKGGHRLPPTIVAKYELVQVNLKLRLADAMIRTDQPLLQVAGRAVRERHHGGRALAQGAPERLGPPNMRDARGLQVLEAFQAVGVDRGSRTDVVLDQRDHRGLFEVRDHGHPHAPGNAPAVFNRRHHNRRFSALELPTAAQTGLWPADPVVVDLHLAMQRLARRVDHAARAVIHG